MSQIAYQLRPATPNDFDFLYRLHVESMKEYVDKTWGWDDAVQERMFREDFDRWRRQIVIYNGSDIGVISTEWRINELFLVLIEISAAFQRHGIGTTIIRDLLEEARRANLPMSLSVLKVNPARQLYKRLGFAVAGETDTHFKMRTSK